LVWSKLVWVFSLVIFIGLFILVNFI
jgi:hypothetical protein